MKIAQVCLLDLTALQASYFRYVTKRMCGALEPRCGVLEPWDAQTVMRCDSLPYVSIKCCLGLKEVCSYDF